MQPLYDVAIIGGGPAGSSAATFLARQGHRVLVLEKEKFPRFHIGESLLPCSMAALDRLGVLEKLDQNFNPKHGGEMASACGTSRVQFFFRDGFELPTRCAYQVTRADFDQLLLDTAREAGAEVHEQTTVTGVSFDAGGGELRLAGSNGTRTVRARFVIDASGRNTVIGTALKLKKPYDHLRKFSVYAHYDGVIQDEGLAATLLRLVRGRDRWFWMIPLSTTRTSIGMVMDTDQFKQQRQSPQEALESALRDQPVIARRMEHATRVTPVHSAGDYSYRNRQLAGDRWLLAGDAAGFIDPIFSTGVFLAIRSGEEAAAAIHLGLSGRNHRPAFRKYARSINRIMDLYLRFVEAWYRPEFIEVISYPVKRFQMAPAINAILAGKIDWNFSIWWRMQLFYLVVFLQRWLPLCPRLSLDPRAAETREPAVAQTA